jgi:hypothetical protein
MHTKKVKQEFREIEMKKRRWERILLMHGLRKTKGKHKAPVIFK